MKKIILFLLICFLGKSQTWQQLGDFPGVGRDDGASFVINNKAYCGTGLAVAIGTTVDFYCLDLSNNTWSTIAWLPFGQERQYACGFSDANWGFIFGGESGGIDFKDLWMYMPGTNSWMAMAPKPGNGVRGAACFVIGSIAYIIGGAYSTTDALAEVWAFNMISNTWTQKNNMPFTCWRSSATSAGGKGYLTFGRDLNGRFRKELYEYNPSLDTWTLINNFPSAGRAYATFQTINNELVIFGGYDTLNNHYNDVWTYNITSGLWTPKIALPSFGRKGGMAFVNNNDLYYTTGIIASNTRLKETWKATFAVGVEEYNQSENTIKVFPNPANDFIKIISSAALSPSHYVISDMLGRIVQENSWIESSEIDIRSLSRGLYLLTLISENKKHNTKLVVE